MISRGSRGFEIDITSLNTLSISTQHIFVGACYLSSLFTFLMQWLQFTGEITYNNNVLDSIQYIFLLYVWNVYPSILIFEFFNSDLLYQFYNLFIFLHNIYFNGIKRDHLKSIRFMWILRSVFYMTLSVSMKMLV